METFKVIKKHHLFKSLNIRIPITIPIEGRGFINQRSTLGVRDRVPS